MVRTQLGRWNPWASGPEHCRAVCAAAAGKESSVARADQAEHWQRQAVPGPSSTLTEQRLKGALD